MGSTYIKPRITIWKTGNLGDIKHKKTKKTLQLILKTILHNFLVLCLQKDDFYNKSYDSVIIGFCSIYI